MAVSDKCQRIGDTRMCHLIGYTVEGARRLNRSPERIRELRDQILAERNVQALTRDIDRGHDVCVLGFRRQPEPLPEDVQPPVAPDEPHEMVSAGLGLRERDARMAARGR